LRYPVLEMSSHETQISGLLDAWNDGDPEALATLMPLVFDDLRAIARRYFERERPDHTLQPTALVHELYLRFAKRRSVQWEGPSHFFGVAAQMMRRLLVDHARLYRTAKRGAGAVKLPLSDDLPVRRHEPEEMLALDEALDRLQAMEPRQAKVMELKSFAGLTNSEIAKTLGVSLTSVKGDLRVARAWLVRELRGDGVSRGCIPGDPAHRR